MAPVIGAATLRRSGAHRQHRLAAFQRLNLALLIDTEHQSVLGRADIQADHVAHLLHKVGIVGQSKTLAAVRLQSERSPDACHAVMGKPTALGHRTGAPVCGLCRGLLQGHAHHLGHLLIADAARRSAARQIAQSVEALLQKALPPASRRHAADSHAAGHLRVAQPFAKSKNRLGPADFRLRRMTTSRQLLQKLTLLILQLH